MNRLQEKQGKRKRCSMNDVQQSSINSISEAATNEINKISDIGNEMPTMRRNRE
jgi:hypothetical protein